MGVMEVKKMKSLEEEIKQQFCKFFTQKDWTTFKFLADYYFKLAAILKKKDIDTSEGLKLLVRNIQKRLFIGIGTELALKAAFLKKGYGINVPKVGRTVYDLNSANPNEYRHDNTFTLDFLIQNFHKIHKFSDNDIVMKGLKIAKVFRNKEGHIITLLQDFKPQNYTDVEASVKILYDEIFGEKLEYQIAMEKGERGIFEIQ